MVDAKSESCDRARVTSAHLERLSITPDETTPNTFVVRLRVPADLRHFEGHFERNPMMPGVAEILEVVDREARSAFPALVSSGAKRMTRLKFLATILPKDELAVHLTFSSEGEPQVRYRIDRITAKGAENAASGALTYTS